MAYNPFNIFRRNQKALFAVLTVFIMIMFTLSSGVAGGDFFDTFARWLQLKGNKEAVCKIDGHTVTVNELDGGPRSVQFKRVMANRFMFYAAQQTVGTLQDRAVQQRSRLSESGRKMADMASGALGGQFGPNPQLIRFVQAEVSRTAFAEGAPAADREVALIYNTIFSLYDTLRSAGTGEHYFVNAPNRNRRDLIEFLLWEKKADQLGIRFSKDDAKRLIQTEFRSAFESDVAVRRQLQQTQGFNMDACLEAIATEFKVRAAQCAVLGYNARFGGAPALTTPYETYEYYREQTSPAVYEVISVPAAAFVDRVPGQPSKSEISALFNKHQDDEPDPSKERPGFKEPRKIAIAYFGVNGEEPYYKKLAEEQIKVGEALAIASGRLSVPLPGAVGAWATGLVGPTVIKEPSVDAAYADYVRQFKANMDIRYGSTFLYERDILDAQWAKPGTAAAVVGAFVGQSAGGGSPANALAVALGAPLGYELRSRVAVGLPLVLGFVPGPGLVPHLAGAAAMSAEREPKPLPVEARKAELLKGAIDKRAKALAYGDRSNFGPTAEKGDLQRFTDELKKLSDGGKKVDKAAAEKFVQDFLAARGIGGAAVGRSSEPRSEFTIEDDPALAALVKVQKESARAARGAHNGFGGLGVEPYMPFGRSFFWTTTPGMGAPRPVPTTGLYAPDTFPPRDLSSIDDRLRYVVWRTEDIPAKKTTASAAEPAVIAAWKRMKARDLAKARADALSGAIRGVKEKDSTLLASTLIQKHYELQGEFADAKSQAQVKRFTISDVAPYVSGPMNPMTGQGGGLMPYLLPDSENIPYTTAEMQQLLVDNRDKPSGTVLVFADAGKDTYYVATLLRRELKSPDDFKSNVYATTGRARDVLQLARIEAATKARKSVVELLKKEFKYEETDKQKEELDKNEKSGGRGDF
jgi:hypothetical protein